MTESSDYFPKFRLYKSKSILYAIAIFMEFFSFELMLRCSEKQLKLSRFIERL